MSVKKTLKKKSSIKKTATKKVTKAAEKASKQTGNITDNVMSSANEIWLAGLGAFAKAQQEGVKIFNKLVDEGKDFETVFKKVPQTAAKEVKTKVDKVKDKATQSWDKLENIFESRVERTLKKLDIPTTEEIGALLNKIETLSSEVAKLTGDYVSDVKEAAQKTVRKSPAKKTVKKATATAKKTAKKATTTAKKTAATAKKATKKVAKKVSKKTTTAAKTVKKTAKKTAKKVAKKTTKKS